MQRQLSSYMDLVRFLAAVVVLLAHASQLLFAGLPLPFPGKDAVIVFFVLSGFVIAYVAGEKDGDLLTYAVNRLSRLWSVLVPAALFSFAISGSGGWDAGWWPSLASAAFIGQIWTLDLYPPYNSPAWSIGYEAFYYAIFGAAVYLAGRRRLLAVAALALLAGLKILVLMPIWLGGVWLYRNLDRLRMTPRAANRLFVVSIALYLVYFVADMNVLLRSSMFEHFPAFMGWLQYSNRFVGDYILALIVASNFVAAAYMKNGASDFLIRWRRPISGAAAYTLTIYLFHRPLIAFFQDLLDAPETPSLLGLLTVALLVPSILLIGRFTELRRGALREFLFRAMAKVRLNPRQPIY
jgi:peptidoglycan/LPS O-acetylase OafA/YrhL